MAIIETRIDGTMAKLGKSLDDLLRKPTTFRDSSFPACGDVVLRKRSYYWLVGGLALIAFIAMLLAQVWAGAERSWIGRGELESWVWRYGWWKRLAFWAWHHDALGTEALLWSAGVCPQIGNAVDFACFSWPLEALFGAPTYYNIKVAIIVGLNCVACWLFLDRIWGSGLYAWVGAILFGFNSYFISEIAQGRCRSALAFAVPLCLRQLYELQRQPQGRRAAGWAGLWLGISAVLCAPYGVVLAGIVGAWWLWGHISLREQRREWARGVVLALAVGAVIYLPWGWCLPGVASACSASSVPSLASFPSISAVQHAQSMVPAHAEIVGHEPGGNALVALGEARRLWQSSLPLNALWDGRCLLALPLLALVLVVIPYAYNWRLPWFWWVIGAVCTLFSLGPFASLASDGLELNVCSSWSLPWAWVFGVVPSGLRLPPSGFLVGVYIALAVLVVQRLRSWNLQLPFLAHGVALLLIIAQFAQLNAAGIFPVPATRLEAGPLVYLLGDSPPQGLVDVPFGGHYLDLAQEIHGCPVMGAEATRCFPATWPATGHDSTSRWAAAKLDWSNSFVAHLAQYQNEGHRWQKFAPGDIANLRHAGYSLLILHERGCNIMAGNSGEVCYFKYFSHLQNCLGDPILNTFEPVYTGMTGRRDVDVSNPQWYRVAVFKI